MYHFIIISTYLFSYIDMNPFISISLFIRMYHFIYTYVSFISHFREMLIIFISTSLPIYIRFHPCPFICP